MLLDALEKLCPLCVMSYLQLKKKYIFDVKMTNADCTVIIINYLTTRQQILLAICSKRSKVLGHIIFLIFLLQGGHKNVKHPKHSTPK